MKLNMINKVINEQKNKKFDEGEIELLNFIFERELKPPFREGEQTNEGIYRYYNRDGEQIGYLDLNENAIMVKSPIWTNIKYKVCQVFGFSHDTWDWLRATKPRLKSWLEYQINIKLNDIY